ncbi:MAG: DUF3391 domain-containing protein [Gammaproteobacteria bacterium]|nr:DUF3391 domain-containing protein [Gammaproteobacteria bacterium]NND61231.1 DUF3391 domain-containing protein [Gammaproteobacteria bacterium]
MTTDTEFDGESTLILSPDELEKGMFVSYLDRPSEETALPAHGFRIETEAELERLRDNCEFVFVNPRQDQTHDYGAFYSQRKSKAGARKKPGPAASPPARNRLHTEKEFPAARQVHSALRDAVIGTYAGVSTGRCPNMKTLERAAEQVIDSIRRNPDALLYIVRTQTDGDYLFRHGVACAVMLCALGDSMGMPRHTLKAVTLGGALLDVGKTRVPRELLNRPTALEFSATETEKLRDHIQLGAEVIADFSSEGSRVVTMIRTHHERFNGKGYPRRLKGDSIPQIGQMAGLVDMFDAMVSERSYGRRATPYEAMRYLKAQRGELFGSSLIDAFINAFGTYPTGTLVELSTGEVGFVIQQNPGSRLQPRVYLVLDRSKQRLGEFKVIDLSEHKQVCVDRSLKAGSYGIDY